MPSHCCRTRIEWLPLGRWSSHTMYREALSHVDWRDSRAGWHLYLAVNASGFDPPSRALTADLAKLSRREACQRTGADTGGYIRDASDSQPPRSAHTDALYRAQDFTSRSTVGRYRMVCLMGESCEPDAGAESSTAAAGLPSAEQSANNWCAEQ